MTISMQSYFWSVAKKYQTTETQMTEFLEDGIESDKDVGHNYLLSENKMIINCFLFNY